MDKLDKIKGCLVGLAIGDALGVHLEFTQKGKFTPITTYTEGNPYGIPLGYWTDDTSMALCMADSLIEKKEFNADDIMKKFCDWQRKGYRSSTGKCFDIGNTTRTALMEYWRNPSGGPFRGSDDVLAAGNGSIMRLAPIPIFYHNDKTISIIKSAYSSKITHANIECVVSCKLMSEILYNIFNEIDWYIKQSSGQVLINTELPESGQLPKNIINIIEGSFTRNTDQINGSGYVIASLEASLHCLYNTKNFNDAVLMAVNLGEDADTTGAVTGQLAGALYGYDSIPQHLKDGLYQHEMIVELAEKLYELSNK